MQLWFPDLEDLSTVRKLEITGRNFGPARSVRNDGVLRPRFEKCGDATEAG